MKEAKGLHAIISILCDTAKTIEHSIKNKVVVEDFSDIAEHLPVLLVDIPNLKEEFEQLKTAEGQADAVAFVLAEVESISDDAHAKAIVHAATDLIASIVVKSVALAAAIKG